MAHFAELNDKNEVTMIIVVSNDALDVNDEESSGIDFLENLYGHRNWKQTSYNSNIRKNYAGIGFQYDADLDGFIAPKPFPSWNLNEETCQWEAPIPYPSEEPGTYQWNEANQTWDALQPVSER